MFIALNIVYDLFGLFKTGYFQLQILCQKYNITKNDLCLLMYSNIIMCFFRGLVLKLFSDSNLSHFLKIKFFKTLTGYRPKLLKIQSKIFLYSIWCMTFPC